MSKLTRKSSEFHEEIHRLERTHAVDEEIVNIQPQELLDNDHYLRDAIGDLEQDLIDHETDVSNPHNVTHAQTGPEGATSGTDTAKNKHVSNADYKRWEDHLANKSNPHAVTAAQVGAAPASHTHTASQVGLGNVQNYGIATQAQAEAGTANDVYMTPLRVANALDLIKDALFPSGGIIMWSGAINDIPVGWALCDGSNGTPDLRDRFIVGAGRKYNVGNTGGADSVTLTVAQMPSHSHSSGTLSTDTSGSHSHTYVRPSGGGSAPSGDYYVHRAASDAYTSSDGSHDHDVTGDTGNTGGGQAHENRPPYYALAYIMKL